jgi:Flp pilus assembly pilin Flp
MRGLERNDRQIQGQGIVEYILITALVALASIAVFRTFRTDISQAYRRAGEALVQGVEDGVSSDPGQP